MMGEMKSWWMLFLLVAPCILQQFRHGSAEPQVPCFFIFGDSLADNGNNDDLPTAAKANYKPYGIDLPVASNPGRFTNGRTINDLLAEQLGFDRHIPPYRTACGSEILQGVNYASGSAGIRAETGQHLGTCLHLKEQMQNHNLTVSLVSEMLGNTSAVSHLNKCLYTVGMGSNDYINNYFVPQHYTTSQNYNPGEYAKDLIRQYSEDLKTLYHYGARKIALFGVGQIGCTPSSTSRNNGTTGCIAEMNEAAQIFNNELKCLVDTLNKNLPGTQFVYINTYGMAEGDPTVLGFKVLTRGCCEVRSDGQCAENKTPCENRAEHVFWDSFHPTEAVNQMMAARTYTAFAPTDAYPFDLSHLVQLDLENSTICTA